MKKLLFAVLIGLALTLVPVALASMLPPVHFSDVNEGDWYADTISDFVQAGYAGGYEDGTFRPNNPITRAETAKIVMRANQLISRNRVYVAELREEVDILKSKLSTLSFPGECYYNETWYSTDEIVDNQDICMTDTCGVGSCTCQSDGSLTECKYN